MSATVMNEKVRKIVMRARRYVAGSQRAPGDRIVGGHITCSGKEDGAGAQAQAVLSTMLLSNDLGLTYVHTPFRRIAHRPDEDGNWEQDWESFFNLGHEEIGIDDLDGVSVVEALLHRAAPGMISIRSSSEILDNRLNVASHCHWYADEVPDNYRGLKERIVAKYNRTSKHHLKLFGGPGKISIAVHVRRGDVSDRMNCGRYTHNSRVAHLLNRVRTVCEKMGSPISVNVFSQGRLEDFSELRGNDVSFHLDHCTFTTLHNLISADVLLMSKSSFSYTAALYSSGIKLYDPWWHPPQSDWIDVGNSANAGGEDLERRLADALRPQ